MSPIVKITFVNGTMQGNSYTFDKETDCIIGRGGDCHCALLVNPPSVLLHDLNSIEGTYINGRKVDSATGHIELQDGDSVRLGRFVMHVQIVEQAEKIDVDQLSFANRDTEAMYAMDICQV